MTGLIRKRCPKCKTIDIYKRKTLKDMIKRSKYICTVRHNIPSNIYHCIRCGHEFDIPFVGPKIRSNVKLAAK